MSFKRMVKTEYNWSPESRDGLAKTGYFMCVGPKQGKVRLSGATDRWANPASKDDLYSMEMRIVGTQEVIEAWMLKNNFSEEKIDQVINNAFGIDNMNDPEFLDAIASEPKRVVSKREDPFQLISSFNAKINQALEQTNQKYNIKLKNNKEEEKTSPNRRNLKKRSPRKVSTAEFQTRYNALKPTQVLNVSELDETGNGAKVMKRPKDMAKFKTREGTNLVSDNESTLNLAVSFLQVE